ncbi:MAG: double zinc ribbon domain-containing protein [Vicinamibacteria bacterium]
MSEIVLCPYCMSPIEEGTVLCPACGQDTTRDAAFEMSIEKYDNYPRTQCPFCGALMLDMAVVCPSCRAPQPEEEDYDG